MDLEKTVERFCDDYCKFPYACADEDELSDKCESCPICEPVEMLEEKGGDFVQHDFSYGWLYGCVEPAIGSRLDSAVPLKNAKALVKRHIKMSIREGLRALERYNKQHNTHLSYRQFVQKMEDGKL